MPKIRTSSTVKKRFKITATGKLMRGCTLQNHRMKKKKNEARRLKREYSVEGKKRQTVVRMLGGK
ncbi:MAG: 50S ribosomal protein L35 [Chloroflexi bacterium]|nr:50S ribosomal protein L35 [Chloroflexota bacterium]